MEAGKVEQGVPPEEIAIVTPYQSQVSIISSLLHPSYPGMTIGSVDGLQGQEREAIILSLVRSNSKGEVGFLREYRRLNVAMTRARRQLVSLVAIYLFLSGSPLWNSGENELSWVVLNSAWLVILGR